MTTLGATLTNRAALALLEDIEARRLANEELAAAATDVIEQAVYGNRAEAYHTALRIVARALPAIVAEAEAGPPVIDGRRVDDDWDPRYQSM